MEIEKGLILSHGKMNWEVYTGVIDKIINVKRKKNTKLLNCPIFQDGRLIIEESGSCLLGNLAYIREHVFPQEVSISGCSENSVNHTS